MAEIPETETVEQPKKGRTVTCPRCGHIIKIADTTISGQTRCNPCGKFIIFDYVMNRKYNQLWRDKNREKVRAYYRKYSGEYRSKNREHVNKLHREATQRRKDKLKQQIFDILGHICVVCGEQEKACLVFHHIKERKFSREEYTSTSSLVRQKMYLEEVENLTVLCANCHRKLHAGIITIE